MIADAFVFYPWRYKTTAHHLKHLAISICFLMDHRHYLRRGGAVVGLEGFGNMDFKALFKRVWVIEDVALTHEDKLARAFEAIKQEVLNRIDELVRSDG